MSSNDKSFFSGSNTSNDNNSVTLSDWIPNVLKSKNQKDVEDGKILTKPDVLKTKDEKQKDDTAPILQLPDFLKSQKQLDREAGVFKRPVENIQHSIDENTHTEHVPVTVPDHGPSASAKTSSPDDRRMANQESDSFFHLWESDQDKA